MICLDVVAHIVQQIRLLPLRTDLGIYAPQLVLVLSVYLPVASEIRLLECGLCEGRLGVEEARKLRDELLATVKEVIDLLLETCLFLGRFRREAVEVGVLRVVVEERFGLLVTGIH